MHALLVENYAKKTLQSLSHRSYVGHHGMQSPMTTFYFILV